MEPNLTVTSEMADKVAEFIKTQVSLDGDKPIAMTIVGPQGQVILTKSMDGVLPESPELSRKKAVTALMLNNETVYWEKRKPPLSPTDFGQPDRFCCLGGGLPVQSPIDCKTLLGGIGVSGRSSYKKGEKHKTPQDHELAELGLGRLLHLLETAANKAT